MKVAYETSFGKQIIGDSIDVLKDLDDNSVNLVMTSPPFALLRKKEYGNESQATYIEWLAEFAKLVYKKLTPDGSFVLDLGGAYKRGVPVRSLYNFRIPIYFCDHLGFHLAEDFYWFNPSKLPSPIEWVNKRKIRVKDAVNNVWWFSKSEFPKADVTNVLAPYSSRMKKLLKAPDKYYSAAERPSGHNISMNFKDNGGAIPPNLLQIPNSESNSSYLSHCKKSGLKGHPARFPSRLPEFFIKFLTDEEDLVVDIFGGSNTTGSVCELLQRNWISIDLEPSYAAISSFRFLPKNFNEKDLLNIYYSILAGNSINISNFLKDRKGVISDVVNFISKEKMALESQPKLNKSDKKTLQNLERAEVLFC